MDTWTWYDGLRGRLYDATRSLYLRGRKDAAREAMDWLNWNWSSRTHRSILDYGAGTGIATEELCRNAGRHDLVTALEPSLTLASRCCKRLVEYQDRSVVVTSDNLIDQGQYDLIFLSYSALIAGVSVIPQMTQYLKDKGLIAVIDFYRLSTLGQGVYKHQGIPITGSHNGEGRRLEMTLFRYAHPLDVVERYGPGYTYLRFIGKRDKIEAKDDPDWPL